MIQIIFYMEMIWAAEESNILLAKDESIELLMEQTRELKHITLFTKTNQYIHPVCDLGTTSMEQTWELKHRTLLPKPTNIFIQDVILELPAQKQALE